MSCCSCKNLDTKKKVDGAVSGAKYLCKKHKVYVCGDSSECDKFAKCSRSASDCDKIYKEGKDWDNDKTSPSVYFFFAILLVIILIIVYLCNPELY